MSTTTPTPIPFTLALWQTGEYEVVYRYGDAPVKVEDTQDGSYFPIKATRKNGSFTVHDYSGNRLYNNASVRDLLLIPRTPQPESKERIPLEQQDCKVGGSFYSGIEWLGAWLVDHAEREVITEELIHRWAVEAWTDHLKKQNGKLVFEACSKLKETE